LLSDKINTIIRQLVGFGGLLLHNQYDLSWPCIMDFGNIEWDYNLYQEWKEKNWLSKETEEEGKIVR